MSAPSSPLSPLLRAIVLRAGALALLVPSAAVAAQSSDSLSAVANSPPVELPPLLVTETNSGPPWLYVQYNGIEYLSRCSASTTRAYVESWERSLYLLSLFVPDRLLHRTDLSAVVVLYPHKLALSTNSELLNDLKTRSALGNRSYSFAPDLRINDRDCYATFAYIDEANFDGLRLSAAPEYVRFLLDRRAPAFPAWFIEGIDLVFRDAIFYPDPITLRKPFWVDWIQTRELARDENYPRALLPAAELFAPDALRGGVNGNMRRVDTRTSQIVLFVRWALLSSPATRDALWQFVAHASEQPATEAMFESCFGFGFSELRDRLSDYLPQAVKENPRLEPGKIPRLPRLPIRNATPAEIARLRGEWERLAIGFVEQRHPELKDRYAEEARRTLQRAFDAGDRDPWLLATRGLCELAADEPVTARLYLEPAAAAGVIRPRVHYEVARLRFADVRGVDAPAQLYSAAALAPVLEPLRAAARLKPLLPEVFQLFGEAIAHLDAPASADDMALLQLGAQTFARHPDASLQLATALARQGKKTEALALLSTGLVYVTDTRTQQRFTQLRDKLKASATP